MYKSISQPKEQTPTVTDKPPEITIKYMFTDWIGDEDILALSQIYIDELEKVVEEGVLKGFISG